MTLDGDEKLTLEDLQAELGGAEDPKPATPPATEPPATEPSAEEPSAEPQKGNDPVPTEPTKTEPKKTEPKRDDGNNPMKDLRDRYNAAEQTRKKIDEVVNRFADGEYDFKVKDFKTEDGKIDYDALIEAMDDADIKARATEKGVSPELQKELERYEKEKQEMNKEKLRVRFDRQVTNFQLENNLPEEKIDKFFNDAIKAGINPYSIAAIDNTSKGTTALNMLYKAVYHDELVRQAAEDAKAQADADRQASNAAQQGQPKPIPGTPSRGKTEEPTGSGISLDDLLVLIK